MRYVHLPANAVDTALLEDATRRGLLRYSGLVYFVVALVANGVKLRGNIEASNAAAAKTR